MWIKTDVFKFKISKNGNNAKKYFGLFKDISLYPKFNYK